MIKNFQELTNQKWLGQELEVGGFIHTIRDHGGLIFIDIRFNNQILQTVINPEENPKAFKTAETLNKESVIKISGILRNRTEDQINPNIPTGKIELLIQEIQIISKAKPLPFNPHEEEDKLAGEETRLKYRYLDLRREKLQKMFKKKHDLILKTRNWFSEQGFIEFQTPILANSSPEGARDFLVPSRLHPGKFFALPQAPQQFKQLLMVGGVEKYFQIAPCFRDEDPRADRHPGDFYQIDAEMAWYNEDDVRELCQNFAREVLVPFSGGKQMTTTDFTRLDYYEAMDKYGSDKPDLRFDLPWQDVKPVFADSGFKVFADLCKKPEARVQALVIKNAVESFSRAALDKIQAIGRDYGLPGIAYIQYYADGPKSPIFKFFGENDEVINNKVAELSKFLQTETGDLVLFIANEDKNIVWKAENSMRKHIAEKLNLIDKNKLSFVWIEGFPFFELDERSGGMEFGHNPFSVWEGGLEALEEASKQGTEGLLKLRARQYDVALNGYEILSGGVRNQNMESLSKAFEIVGYTKEEVKTKFGHMLEAYTYGAPTHAGFAWGLDRLFMVLVDEENIREVIAFPKNGSGMDVMLNSPSKIRESQLKELNLELDLEE